MQARTQALSVPRVLWSAMSSLTLSVAKQPDTTTYFAGEALGAESSLQPESAIGLAAAPPAKRLHLRVCEMTPGLYNALGLQGWPEHVMPLLSQPLIELCLSIPTYELAAGGVDRALARAAFSDGLPETIVRRTRKGSIDAYLDGLLSHNLPFMREVMLDGQLVHERLLDRDRIEQALSPRPPVTGRHAGELICRHLNTEIWLQSWSRNQRSFRSIT